MGFETTRYAKTRPGRRGGVRSGERWGRREPGAGQTRGVALLGPSRSRGSRSQRGLGRGRASVGGGRLFSSRERFGPRGRSVDLPPRPLRTRTTSALARGSSFSVTRLTSFLSSSRVCRTSRASCRPRPTIKPSRRAEILQEGKSTLKRRALGPTIAFRFDFVFPVRSAEQRYCSAAGGDQGPGGARWKAPTWRR